MVLLEQAEKVEDLGFGRNAIWVLLYRPCQEAE